MERTTIALLVAAALALAACGGGDATPSAATDDAPAATTDEVAAGRGEPGNGVGAAECPAGDEPDVADFETARLYIEHNATDADTGVHAVLGGEAWKVMCVSYPDGSPMLVADPLGDFDTLAVSDLLFESREPENSEVPISDIQSWFPEGMYRVAAVSYDGVAMVGEAWFTHAIPAAPAITSPQLAEDAETAGDSVVARDEVVVAWEPVTETIDGGPVVMTGYEVIVTDEEYEDPHGNSKPEYDVHVGADVTALSVPAEFLRPNRIYEVEVLALEESGNQTISIGFFTAGP